tara:strand:+ start:3805 stop:5028 length:1224 start_codon:yes stop_codon:yes gene_type:complete
MKCRHCNSKLENEFIDLGNAPPSNNYVSQDKLKLQEKSYPLRVMVCSNCWLVQTEDFSDADELFTDEYAYFSSTSISFLEHAKNYVSEITKFLKLNQNSFVVELASNDGYLLKNFVELGIPCLGIEPTKSTANVSRQKGIETIEEFFGIDCAKKLSQDKKADLIIGNNVYAHVPDINDFTAGIKELLSPDGTVTLEFPHLVELIQNNQFDTIYHEHYSYLSLFSVSQIFNKAGLKIYKVDKLQTHGGSLRIYGCHKENNMMIDKSYKDLINKEIKSGINDINFYKNFNKIAEKIKDEFYKFLIDCKEKDLFVCAYGAAAKGNTLLNYCGIKDNLINFVCDAAEAKQNKFLPGSKIPIVHPDVLKNEKKIDFVIIFPWNIADEVIAKLDFLKANGTKFVMAIPKLTII